MGKPVKIHKKKSFMFTTKHQSFPGWLGTAVGVFCWMVGITLVIGAFHRGGKVGVNLGAIGLFTVILNVLGLVSGIIGLRERDIKIVPPIVAIVLNGLMLLSWLVLIVLAQA